MSLIEIKRNLRSASIVSGFIAFAIWLLITQGKVSIPFFNFALILVVSDIFIPFIFLFYIFINLILCD